MTDLSLASRLPAPVVALNIEGARFLIVEMRVRASALATELAALFPEDEQAEPRIEDFVLSPELVESINRVGSDISSDNFADLQKAYTMLPEILNDLMVAQFKFVRATMKDAKGLRSEVESFCTFVQQLSKNYAMDLSQYERNARLKLKALKDFLAAHTLASSEYLVQMCVLYNDVFYSLDRENEEVFAAIRAHVETVHAHNVALLEESIIDRALIAGKLNASLAIALEADAEVAESTVKSA